MSAARVVLRYSDGGMLVEQDGEYVVVEPAPPSPPADPGRLQEPNPLALEYCDLCGNPTDEEPDGYARVCDLCQMNPRFWWSYHSEFAVLARSLLGDRFGRWTVVGKGGPGRWRVRCACGTEREHGAHALQSGTSTGCVACSARAMIDLTGKTFGRLSVLRRAPELDEPGHTFWVVRCACGQEEACRSADLRLRGKHRCKWCRRAESLTSPAAKVAWAVRGQCSWCPRAAAKLAFECEACNRQGLPSRGGRDATGRPRSRGQRVGDLMVCKCGCGSALSGRPRYASDACFRRTKNAARAERHRALAGGVA